MRRFVFIAFLTFLISKIDAQTASNCNCGAIVDPEFKGKIVLYDKPYGSATKIFQQDFTNDDYLILTISKDTLGYFRVYISNALTPENGKTGWIKKTREIGTFARNYEPNDTLKLYSKPEVRSKVQSIVPEWTNQLYTISKCVKNWVYVTLEYKGQMKEGWLPPDKQCDNPYTTCN